MLSHRKKAQQGGRKELSNCANQDEYRRRKLDKRWLEEMAEAESTLTKYFVSFLSFVIL